MFGMPPLFIFEVFINVVSLLILKGIFGFGF